MPQAPQDDESTRDASAPSSHQGRWRRWLTGNGLVLLLPALIFNLVLVSRLPEAYQTEVFWNDIPALIAIPENLLRLIVFMVPALMLYRCKTRLQRAGRVLFVVGSVIYAASWLALILVPQSAWSTSAVGFTAPAYTPALWFAGLAMMLENFVWPQRWYRFWMYGACAAAFLGVHIAHAALIFARLY